MCVGCRLNPDGDVYIKDCAVLQCSLDDTKKISMSRSKTENSDSPKSYEGYPSKHLPEHLDWAQISWLIFEHLQPDERPRVWRLRRHLCCCYDVR
jgi:hypothetical protein